MLINKVILTLTKIPQNLLTKLISLLAVQGEMIVDQGVVLEADPMSVVLAEMIAIDAVVVTEIGAVAVTAIGVMVETGTRIATTVVKKM